VTTLVAIQLDDARFGSGPATVVSHPKSVADYLFALSASATRDRMRLWCVVNDVPDGSRVTATLVRGSGIGSLKIIACGRPAPSTRRPAPYVGLRAGARTVFRSDTIPTQDTHPEYGAVIGPFRTMRAARFLAEHGGGNPHLVTIAQIERAAKKAGKKGSP